MYMLLGDLGFLIFCELSHAFFFCLLFFCKCCSFGSKHVTPRTLSSHFIGNMVCVEGIVTKCESSLINEKNSFLLQMLHKLFLVSQFLRYDFIDLIEYSI